MKTTTGSTIENLHLILETWIQRHRLQRVISNMPLGAAAGLSSATLICLFLISSTRLLLQEAIYVLVGGVVVGAVLGGITPWLKRSSNLDRARFFEQHFGLQERISTALEIGLSSDGTHLGQSPFAQLLLDDAIFHAQKVNIRLRLPIRPHLRVFTPLILVVLFSIGVLWAGRTQLHLAAAQRQEQRAITTAAQEIQQLIEEISSTKDIPPEQVQTLTAPLHDALAALDQAANTEEAMAALETAQAELESMSQDPAMQTAQQLQASATALDNTSEPGSPLAQFSQSLAEGDLAAAANALTQINPSELTEGERQALAEQLASMASSLQAIDPTLAASLATASQALQSADQASDATRSLAEAARQLTEVADQVQQAGQAQALAQNLANQQAALAESASSNQPGATASGLPGDAGVSSNTETLDGNTPGSGAGRGDSDSSVPATSGTGGPVDSANSPGDGGLEALPPASSGDRPLSGDGELVSMPPSGLAGDQLGSAINPGSEVASQVPYTQVYAAYLDAYRQAQQQGSIPLHMQDIVRQYFTSLAP